MNVLMLLRSELRRSAAVLAGIAAVLALSLSISIATGMTDRMLRHASAQAADRFDLLIGAKASPSSLLLGAVFLRDEPLPLVPLSVMKDLDERHGVKWAAPVAFGDRAGDSPIVGTTTSLVTFGGTVRPAEGRLFKAPFEAVVGASAPYRIGDEIVPMHGRTPGAGHAHDHGRLNVVSAESLVAAYDNIDGLKLDFDHAVGGEILHDLHKPWVFQWEADNACRKEEALAGTGEHHVLSIAESIKRGLPAEFVVAQACAHEHPGSASGEAQVVGWLRAAAIIAGVDPVKAGLIAADGKTLPLPRRIEGWVVHLADHDWVISVPACQWVVKALRNLAEKKWGVRDEKTFNALRNYVLCNLTAMRLYGILSAQGEEAFAADVARVVKA